MRGVHLEAGNAVEFEQFRPRSSQQRHCWSHEIAQPSRTGRPDEKHKWRTVRGSGLESAIAPDPRARIWANPIVRLGAKPDKSV
jgi:hypothetical protein